ncbi:hypothetical protein E1A91_D05G192200v1 [Gossypium mustelinum]|uniref:Secondary thiamine-phosphate synthase enzyme n=1 Tax=Gossypium mustelinum TaxID=34275 RepID=A0A5D2UXU9_GOSMU|nr:hypothetical protein E1A91_D05G192200v1 [Gossypium mustelinum]
MLMQSSAIFSSKPAWVKAVHRTSSTDSNSMAATVPAPKWAQKTVTLPPLRRGCHLVTSQGRSAPWKHTLEGPDDMPAHIKSSMFGCALTIPITDGRLNMGTWQGIWLCEHRDAPTARRVVVTLNGI